MREIERKITQRHCALCENNPKDYRARLLELGLELKDIRSQLKDIRLLYVLRRTFYRRTEWRDFVSVLELLTLYYGKRIVLSAL